MMMRIARRERVKRKMKRRATDQSHAGLVSGEKPYVYLDT